MDGVMSRMYPVHNHTLQTVVYTPGSDCWQQRREKQKQKQKAQGYRRNYGRFVTVPIPRRSTSTHRAWSNCIQYNLVLQQPAVGSA